MSAILVTVELASAYGAGYLHRKLNRVKYRHKHTWEVVEKSEQPSALEASGMNMERLLDSIKAVNFDYHPSTDSIKRLTRRESLIHYRCSCGEERIERL